MTQDPQSIKEAKPRWNTKLCYKKLRLGRSQARGLITIIPVAAVILCLGFQSGNVNSKSIESVPQMEEITKVHDRNGKVRTARTEHPLRCRSGQGS